jgi:glycosidase
MQEFDRLLEEAHRPGLKVILDFVPNDSSDHHPWFVESLSSRENPKRDWYLWRDEPNNWRSNFGGSGWEWDERTNQYYYHSFLKEQPDLNWRNPAVRTAMRSALRCPQGTPDRIVSEKSGGAGSSRLMDICASAGLVAASTRFNGPTWPLI